MIITKVRVNRFRNGRQVKIATIPINSGLELGDYIEVKKINENKDEQVRISHRYGKAGYSSNKPSFIKQVKFIKTNKRNKKEQVIPSKEAQLKTLIKQYM